MEKSEKSTSRLSALNDLLADGYDAFSTNEESFTDYDSVMDELEWSLEQGEKATIYIGRSVKKTHADYVWPGHLLESIAEAAYDDMGEFAEDYLSDLLGNKEAEREFQELICSWLEKKAGPVRFCGVDDIKEAEVIVGVNLKFSNEANHDKISRDDTN